jgi:hypothetical protein
MIGTSSDNILTVAATFSPATRENNYGFTTFARVARLRGYESAERGKCPSCPCLLPAKMWQIYVAIVWMAATNI